MKKNTGHNGQLDIGEFASIVSHDLRAPIRHISQFTSILADSLQQFDEDKQNCMQHIQNSVQKCNDMMNGLNLLAQISKSTQQPSAIDFAAEFERCLQKASAIYAVEPTTTLAIEHDRPAMMQCNHLRQLLGALIDNSFKFHPNAQQLALKLDVSIADDNLRIALSDNGPGIPTAFRDQAAMIFKQLSPHSAGVGIGLTHACYIANYYGGTLAISGNDADSGSQAGTTIEIVVPLGRLSQVA